MKHIEILCESVNMSLLDNLAIINENMHAKLEKLLCGVQ